MQTQSRQLLARFSSVQLPAVWRWCMPVWFVSRLALWGWGFLLWYLHIIPLNPGRTFYLGIQPVQEGILAPLLWVWLRWDGVHYLRIAEYNYNAEDLSAFFPLYPLVSRWLSPVVGGNNLAALLLVANLAFLGVLILLYKLIEEQFGTSTARKSTVIVALFPASVFFTIPYPHSLALFLTLGAYYCARRSRWLLTAVLGILGGLAHSTVFPLAILLGYLVWKETGRPRFSLRSSVWLVPLTPLLGYAAFMAWRVHQGFPAQTSLLLKNWGVYAVPPWKALLNLPLLVKVDYFPSIGWMDLAMFLLATFFAIRFFRNIPTEAWLYQVSLILFLLSIVIEGVPLHGFTRYVIVMFPLFVEIAFWASTKWRRLAGTMAAVALQLYLTGLYLIWGWVG